MIDKPLLAAFSGLAVNTIAAVVLPRHIVPVVFISVLLAVTAVYANHDAE